MTTSLDAGSLDAGPALTSLSIPTRQRCSRLLPGVGRGRWRQDAVLLGLAVLLPLLAGILGAHSLKMGLAVVACVGLIVAVLMRPVLGGMILVGLVPFLSGLAPGLLVPSVRASEALIGVVGVTTLIATRRLATVRWGTLEWLLLAYGVVWAVLGVVDAHTLGQKLNLAGWGTVFGQLQFFLLYRAIRVTVRTRRQRSTAIAVLVAGTIPMAIIAILQEAGIGGLRVSLADITGNTSPIQSTSIIRATALFGNWAALAGYLFPILMVLVALALAGQLRRRGRVALVVGALMIIGILITAELSVIICSVIGVLVLGARYGRARTMLSWLAIAAAVAACVVGPVIGNRLDQQFGSNQTSGHSSLVPQTVGFREDVWTQQYLPAVAQRPLDGYGSQLPSSVQWPYPESQYIALLIDGGWPLFITYLLLLLGMFDQARRIARSKDPTDQAIGRALLVCVVSLVALGITWPFVSNGGLPQVLWCLFAIAAPASSRLERVPPGLPLLASAPAP